MPIAKTADFHATKDAGIGRHIKKGFIGSLLLRILQASFGLIISIVIARLAGPKGVGQYGIFVATASLLAIPAQTGIARMLSREITILEDGRDWASLKGLILWGCSASLFLSGIAAIVVWLISLAFPDLIFSAADTWLGIGLATVFSLSSVLASVLRGLRHVILAQLFEPVRNALFLVALAFFYSRGGSITLHDCLAIYLLGNALSVAYMSLTARNHLPRDVRTAVANLTHHMTWTRRSLPFLIIGALMTVNARIDILMIDHLSSTTQAGFYQVSSQVAGLLLFGLNALVFTTSPWITKLKLNADNTRLQRLMTRSSQMAFGFALLAGLAVALCGHLFLRHALGTEFNGAYDVLLLLAIGQIVESSTGAAAPLLTQTGNERKTMNIVIGTLVLKVVANAILIPIYGAAGAGISFVIMEIVLNIALWIMCRKYTGIDVFFIPFKSKAKTEE